LTVCLELSQFTARYIHMTTGVDKCCDQPYWL